MKLFGLNEGELLLIGGAAFFILKGVGKLPSLITQSVETVAADAANIPISASNSVIKQIYGLYSFPIDFVHTLTGDSNYTYETPEGEYFSWLQTPPSSTFVKNEAGEGWGYLTNEANPLPENIYTGLNEWGDGVAILTSDHPISYDWIPGLHLW